MALGDTIVARAEYMLRQAERAEEASLLSWHKAKDMRRKAEENLVRVRRLAAQPRVDSTPEGTDGPPVSREGQPQG
jgi:hypothetical protein